MRVAIVDDEETVRVSLMKMLKMWADRNCLNIVCDYFCNGEGFLAAMGRKQYDLVFMDIYMEQMDGIKTAGKMRKISADCCLIFLTSSEEHMMQAFPCHAFDYLLKPLEEERLASTLADLLRIFPEKQPYLNLPLGKQTIPFFIPN